MDELDEPMTVSKDKILELLASLNEDLQLQASCMNDVLTFLALQAAIKLIEDSEWDHVEVMPYENYTFGGDGGGVH